MGKRIWQYPEATSISENDYLLLDNQTDGSKSIKANLVGSILIDKTVTERKTYTAADDNVDGYKKVIVDVPYTDVHYQKGDIVTFDDGEDLPLASLKTTIVPIQSGSGDPSPSNVRPISGWSAVNVTRTGKNLFGGEYMADVIVSKVQNATKNTTNKTVSYSAGYIRNVVLFDKFKPNTQYTFVNHMSSGVANIAIGYSDGTITSLLSNNITVSNPNKTVMSLLGEWQTGNSVLLYEQFGIFEGVLTASDFEPYNGTTYTIPFTDSQGQPIEVYGGEVDCVNGGGSAYKEYDSYNGETLIGPWISDRDVYVPNTSPTIGAQVVDMGDTSTFTSQPTSIKSLEGVNNVWGDCGPVAVEWQTLYVTPTE